MAKPKTRAEQIEWAENLGFEALCDEDMCNVNGGNWRVKAAQAGGQLWNRGVQALRGGAATHGGGVSGGGCCPWQSYIKKGFEAIGMPKAGQYLHEAVKWGKGKIGM